MHLSLAQNPQCCRLIRPDRRETRHGRPLNDLITGSCLLLLDDRNLRQPRRLGLPSSPVCSKQVSDSDSVSQCEYARSYYHPFEPSCCDTALFPLFCRSRELHARHACACTSRISIPKGLFGSCHAAHISRRLTFGRQDAWLARGRASAVCYFHAIHHKKRGTRSHD